MIRLRFHPGIAAALAAAALFGVSTPLAKLLVGTVAPVMLAGLLYLGSGIGLLAWFWQRRLRTGGRDLREATLVRADLGWLAGAIVAGGVVGPVLLMQGLLRTTAASASLLLNLEGVLTALLAWWVFHENVDRRVAAGMGLIVVGGVLVSWQGRADFLGATGPLLIAGACLAWALDNNLTRKISAGDPVQIAGLKGLVAGLTNTAIALALGDHFPVVPTALAAGVVGAFGYGVSLVLFVVALRHLGTARTGAYFSTAPFLGAAASLALLRESLGPLFWPAAGLMALGVWLHLMERHEHLHEHESQAHAHPHVHDAHHWHAHDFPWDGAEPHTHFHVHGPLAHSHPHYPDIHHRHRH